MLNKELILKKLEENKNDLRSFGVKKIELFGSYARNEQDDKSDIDFLVEFEGRHGLFNDYISLLHFLEDLFEKKIDIGEEKFIKEGLFESISEGKRYEARI